MKIVDGHVHVGKWVDSAYAGREFDEGKKITWRDGITALYNLFKYRISD